MKLYAIRFDNFGVVRTTMLRANSKAGAANRFTNMYGFDIVDVREVVD